MAQAIGEFFVHMEEGLDIELHPGITEDELDEPTTSDDSDMEMPLLVDDDSGAPMHCNCHRKCDAMDLENICGVCLPSSAKLSETDLIESVFQAVKAVVHAKENEGQKSIVWRLGDTVVCKPFWCFVNNTSPDTVDDIMAAQLPKFPSDNTCTVSKNQFAKADAWFLQLYQNLAEPMPTEEPEEVKDMNHPLWGLSMSGDDNQKRLACKRSLNLGNFDFLWVCHKHDLGEASVSRTMLWHCWNERWKMFMPFRGIGHGKHCKTCAIFDEFSMQATTEKEKEALAKGKQEHIDQEKADHLTMDAMEPSADGVDNILKLTIDSMDQAKFAGPKRN